MNGTVKKCLQWTYLSTICLIALGAFVMLAGEENPRCPIPLREWAAIKLAALVVIALCVCIGKLLYRLGYLPKFLDKLVEEDI